MSLFWEDQINEIQQILDEGSPTATRAFFKLEAPHIQDQGRWRATIERNGVGAAAIGSSPDEVVTDVLREVRTWRS